MRAGSNSSAASAMLWPIPDTDEIVSPPSTEAKQMKKPIRKPGQDHGKRRGKQHVAELPARVNPIDPRRINQPPIHTGKPRNRVQRDREESHRPRHRRFLIPGRCRKTE